MATGQMAEASFHSTLAGDPDLGVLVQMFVDEMPERVANLRGSWSANDRPGLGRCAHQLKGAAGSYGFHQLTPYAASLDAAIRRDAAHDEIAGLLEALLDACDRVRPGQPTT